LQAWVLSQVLGRTVSAKDVPDNKEYMAILSEQQWKTENRVVYFRPPMTRK
jgi:hypothetical protein